MKPIHHVLSFIIAASSLAAAEPYVEIKPPVQDLPEGFGSEAYRMTVEPGKDDFVLAKYQEFEDVRA